MKTDKTQPDQDLGFRKYALNTLKGLPIGGFARFHIESEKQYTYFRSLVALCGGRKSGYLISKTGALVTVNRIQTMTANKYDSEDYTRLMNACLEVLSTGFMTDDFQFAFDVIKNKYPKKQLYHDVL